MASGCRSGGRGPRRHPAEQQEHRHERGDQHLDGRDPRQDAKYVDSVHRDGRREPHVEVAECRKGIIQAGHKGAEDGGEQRSRRAIGPAGSDPERTAGQHGERRCRRRTRAQARDRDARQRCPNASSVKASVSWSGSRSSAIATRRAWQSCMISTRLTELDHEAGRHDLGPAGIRVQRRLDFVKRGAQQIGFLAILDRRQPASAQSLRRYRPRLAGIAAFRVERHLAVLDRCEQRKQRQHVLAQALQAAHDVCRSGGLIVEMTGRARRFAEAAAARRMRSSSRSDRCCCRSGHPRRAGAHQQARLSA